MTKRYDALVLEIDEIVEEEVVLLVGGTALKCFTSYCPYFIEVGKHYTVEFNLILSEPDCVMLAKEGERKVDSSKNGFSCAVHGYLDGPILRSVIDFVDLEIHYRYPALNQKYIEINVDRIDVSFV
jgi:hypothetical protein